MSINNLEQIYSIKCLEDITNNVQKDFILFKSIMKVFSVKQAPNIQFRICADWDGNWITGNWFRDSKRIESPDELFNNLPKDVIFEIACNLDIIKEMSGWDKKKFLSIGDY